MLKGLHHVSLKVHGPDQFEAALHFYRDLLGFSPLRTWARPGVQGAMLSLGNTILEIASDGAPDAQKGLWGHIAFATDDVDGIIQTVRQAGYPILTPPSDRQLGPDYPIRIAFCAGPAGEEIEFFQER